jgi:phosphotriesterase-related protein
MSNPRPTVVRPTVVRTTTVRTVSGDVAASELGRVLMHEHLLSLLPGPGLGAPDQVGSADGTAFDDARVEAAVTALSGLEELGFRTVVDLSPYGDVGRDDHGLNTVLLRRIAERSGLNIVSGTATYRQEFSPTWVTQARTEELADRFIEDASVGIGSTQVRAGILGEQPTSEGRITALEARGLRAAARAHHATGLALSTHTTHGTMALEQLDLLEEQNVDLSRVVIGHMDNHPDLDYVRRVLDRGANVGFDSIGKQHWDVRRPPPPIDQPDGRYPKQSITQSDQTRARHLADLARSGYASQIVLSQDLTGGQVWQNSTTHGRHGYAYLGRVFVPLLAEYGVDGASIETMLHGNPTRLLAIPS